MLELLLYLHMNWLMVFIADKYVIYHVIFPVKFKRLIFFFLYSMDHSKHFTWQTCSFRSDTNSTSLGGIQPCCNYTRRQFTHNVILRLFTHNVILRLFTHNVILRLFTHNVILRLFTHNVILTCIKRRSFLSIFLLWLCFFFLSTRNMNQFLESMPK